MKLTDKLFELLKLSPNEPIYGEENKRTRAKIIEAVKAYTTYVIGQREEINAPGNLSLEDKRKFYRNELKSQQRKRAEEML